MKKATIAALLFTTAVHAQQPIYGSLISKQDSILADGIMYHTGDKLGVSGSDDSVTIKALEQRKYKEDTLSFAVLKGGYRQALDIATQEAIGHGQTQALAKDTITTSVGYKIGLGQKIKLGAGTGMDGDFKFVRINAASLFRHSGTDTRGARAANSADPSYAGLEFSVRRIERRGVPNHGSVNYLIINAPLTGLVKLEVDIERAIRSGEVEVPEEYKAHPASTVIMQAPSSADELLKFKKLLDAGAITQQEYDGQKAKLLSK